LQQLGARQKIVVMSGYSEEETKQRCTALGATGFLRKPFELETIVAKIQTCLN
jgi:CheY-like chemotaxis protein